jgi:hypothetical protein
MQADRLLGPVVTDTDGNSEDRSDTVSVFNGPPPTVHALKTESKEATLVGNWIAELGQGRSATARVQRVRPVSSAT